jgi:hypothetical protein
MIVILGGASDESLREAVRLNVSQAVYEPWALDVLEDEAGSERWKRKKDELEKVKAQIEKLWNQM